MSSRYLLSIDAELKECDSIERVGVLMTKKATYVARMGDFEESARLLRNLRADPHLYSMPKVATWVTFADGVFSFFQDLHDEALDRWSRSRALGVALDAPEIIASSCAWLAHLAFGRFNVAALRENLGVAVDNVQKADHDCLARLCLVLAVSMHLAGLRDQAGKWYARSRGAALVHGDDATVSAILYNMAAMDVAYFRWLAMASAGVSGPQVVPEAESADNFDRLVGVASLEDFTPLLKAQAYSLGGRYGDAAALYSDSLINEPTSTQRRHRGWLLADWSYCLMRIGNTSAAVDLAGRTIGYLDAGVQCDDLAAAHSRLSMVYLGLSDVRSHEYHAAEATRCWREFSLIQQHLTDIVQSLSSRLLILLGD